MKKPECPNCGSENVMLETDLPEIQFWIDENENVDFEPTDIRDRLESRLEWLGKYVDCKCLDCGKSWSYEDY